MCALASSFPSPLRSSAAVGCVLCASLLGSCISGSQTVDHPLYPESRGKLPPEQVARLVGYVRSVDGRDVSDQDGGFLLLPGCHTVITPSEWGRGDPNSGSVVAQTGPVPFALPMRANHQYVVEVETGLMTGPTASLTIKAYERDAQGNTVGEFGPAQSDADLEKCRAVFETDAPAP